MKPQYLNDPVLLIAGKLKSATQTKKSIFRRVSLEDMVVEKIEKMDDSSLGLHWDRLIAWYEEARANSLPVEEFVQVAQPIIDELAERKHKIMLGHPLVAAARHYSESKKEVVIDSRDFKHGQLFELESDSFSDKGPATGTVLATYDGHKLMIEFDEPQTFDLSEIITHLDRTSEGWVLRDKPVYAKQVLAAEEPGTYVKRMLLNADELCSWAVDTGFKNIVPAEEMHVTQVYSCKPVDIDTLDNIIVNQDLGGDPRRVERLGNGGAIVLMFSDDRLQRRWEAAQATGAAWDYSTYRPRITVSYDAGDIDISKIEAPTMPLVLGPEVEEELNDDWAEDKNLRVRKGYKKINGWPYEIDTAGIIRNIETKEEVKSFVNQGAANQYKRIALCRDGKTAKFYVHRLVASTFLQNSDNKEQVNHKNKNTFDNRSCNLEWCTASENSLHKNYVEDSTQCEFCECEASKILVWGGNSKRTYVCSEHINAGTLQIMDVYRDNVNQIIDLTPVMQQENKKSGTGVEIHIKICKAQKEQQLVTGIVLEPDTKDAHDDVVSCEEIEKAAHDFLIKSRLAGVQHTKKAQAEVVESYIALADIKVGKETIKKGSWVMTMKILSKKLWKEIKAGKYTGYSIGGLGLRSQL